jgi:hypothetical protein
MGHAVQAFGFVPGPPVDEQAEGEGVEVGKLFRNDANAGVDLFETYLIPCG